MIALTPVSVSSITSLKSDVMRTARPAAPRCCVDGGCRQLKNVLDNLASEIWTAGAFKPTQPHPHPTPQSRCGWSLGVLRVCAEFGGWLWNAEDKQGFVVFHLDASRHHAQWECDETGTPPSQLLEHYRHAAAAQARGEPVEAVLKYVPQTTGKRVLAESGLCQKYAS